MSVIDTAAVKRLFPTIGADSQPRQNDADMPPVPQWSRELRECWKACREQLLARVQAAGRQ